MHDVSGNQARDGCAGFESRATPERLTPHPQTRPTGKQKVLDNNLGNIRTLGLRKPTKAHRVLESAEEPQDGSRQEK